MSRKTTLISTENAEAVIKRKTCQMFKNLELLIVSRLTINLKTVSEYYKDLITIK